MGLYILSMVTGMFIALIFLFVGYNFGVYKTSKEVKEIKKVAKELKEEIDDFPKTLDGKFFSREMAIKNMSMKDGDD